MPIIILGGILSGVFTPTESAAVAVLYAFILAKFVYKEMSWKDFFNCTVQSVVSSATITLIMSAAAPFAWILTMENAATRLGEFIFGLNLAPVVVIGAIIVILLILGTFMEACSIIIILTPVLLPIVTALGMDPVHFGAIMVAGTDIGAVTPPLAVTLYTSCNILKIKIQEVFPDIWYVLGAMAIGVILIATVPALSLWIPEMLLG